MARRPEPGIDYYPKNTNQVTNDKIKLLMSEFDTDGYWIYECLLSAVYHKKGYYMDLNDREKLTLFASDVCKKKVSLVDEVIKGCVRRDLFDKTVFDMFNVLTSDRIQENWIQAKWDSMRKGTVYDVFEEYILTDFSKTNVLICSLANKTGNHSHSSWKNKDSSGRNKGSSMHKEKEIKEEKSKTNVASPFDVALNNFLLMREKIKKPATEEAISLIRSKLDTLSEGDVALKIKILEQSTLNCWKDLFPLNTSGNNQESKKTAYPDYFDKSLYDKLFNNVPQKHGPYVDHLKKLGFEWETNNGTYVKMVKK